MYTIVHKITVAAPVGDVFNKISTIEGLKSWWTESIEGQSAEGSEIHFKFPSDGPRMKVLEILDKELIKWQCIEGPEEWLNTILTFEFEEKNGITEVLFAHASWVDQNDFFAHCSTKWAVYMLSIKSACEQGEGRPFPNDIKIDVDEK